MGETDTVLVAVEIPRGSRNKYEYDPSVGAIVLDRMLFTSMVFPADCGYIEGKAVTGEGFGGRDEAQVVIAAARDRVTGSS